jgi:hypothetical protein
MGYRSEVRLAMTEKVYLENEAKIKENLKDADLMHCSDVMFFVGKDKDGANSDGYKEEKVYYFLWESVKWYDDFDDVKAINTFVDENDEDTQFLRIGEEDDDIERSGNSELGICFIRSTDIDGGEEVDMGKFFASNLENLINEK